MAMTLRTSSVEDKALDALVKRWGVSKNEAALRAIRQVAEASSREVDIMALSRAHMQRDAAIMERLKNA